MSKLAEALIPDTPTVCGRKLRPLSLGHLVLLFIDENRILTSRTDEWEARDLLFAAAVCSMTWEEGLQFARGEMEPLDMQMSEPVQDAIALVAHIQEGNAPPGAVPADPTQQADLGCEWDEALVVTLCKDLGFSFTETMDFPIKAARRLAITARELSTGKRAFEKPMDEDMIEELRAMAGGVNGKI